MQIPQEFDKLRKEMKLISEKTRYKILLTLFASEKALSFSQLRDLLPSVPENTLNYHLSVLKSHNLIKNRKKKDYKRSEERSFYSLNDKSITLLTKLGLNKAKEEFQELFRKLI